MFNITFYNLYAEEEMTFSDKYIPGFSGINVVPEKPKTTLHCSVI